MATIYKIVRVHSEQYLSAVIFGANQLEYAIEKETIAPDDCPIFAFQSEPVAAVFMDVLMHGDEQPSLALLECVTTDEPTPIYTALSACYVWDMSRSQLHDGWLWHIRSGKTVFDFSMPYGTVGVQRLTPIKVLCTMYPQTEEEE